MIQLRLTHILHLHKICPNTSDVSENKLCNSRLHSLTLKSSVLELNPQRIFTILLYFLTEFKFGSVYSLIFSNSMITTVNLLLNDFKSQLIIAGRLSQWQSSAATAPSYRDMTRISLPNKESCYDESLRRKKHFFI